MPKKTLACLALVLALGGCGVTPEERVGRARVYNFDWPREGIRATLEYRTLNEAPRPTCAGSVRIENYGSRRYTVLLAVAARSVVSNPKRLYSKRWRDLSSVRTT